MLNHLYIHHISSEVVTHTHTYDSISELAPFPVSRSMGKLFVVEFVYYSLVVTCNCYSVYFQKLSRTSNKNLGGGQGMRLVC